MDIHQSREIGKNFGSSNRNFGVGCPQLVWTAVPWDRGEAGGRPARIPVPPGLSRLREDGRMLPLPEAEQPDGDAARVVEPLLLGGRPRLLVVSGDGSTNAAGAARLNGRPAPLVCLLEVGDQLLLPGGTLLRLAVFHPSRIAAPTADQAGHKCALCRTPIGSGGRIYACPTGCLLHFEAEPGTAAPLECAKVGDSCPVCRRRIELEEGFDEGDDAD